MLLEWFLARPWYTKAFIVVSVYIFLQVVRIVVFGGYARNEDEATEEAINQEAGCLLMPIMLALLGLSIASKKVEAAMNGKEYNSQDGYDDF